MLALLLAATVAASPTPCPSDLVVANPQLKVVRALDKQFDNYIVTVDVKNQGTSDQRPGIDQHLDIVKDGNVIGTQPIPPLHANGVYPAAFRIQFPHARRRDPLTVTFHSVMADKRDVRDNCSTDNDLLTVKLR
jgi:CARDB